MKAYYFKLFNLIQSYRLSKELVDQIKEDHSILTYYKLVNSQTETRIINPQCTKTEIVLQIPVPPDLIKERVIDIYVNDQKSLIDVMIYEAGIGSSFVFTAKNMYTSDEKENLVVVVKWTIQTDDIKKSALIWLGILSSMTIISLPILYYILNT